MEHEEAAHGAAEHAGGGFPPFDQLGEYGVSQVFWLAVCFLVLYFLLSNVFLPKLKKAIEDRDGAIAGDVAAAAALSAKAEASTKAVEAQIAEARARARDTASKAKSEADALIAAETAKIDGQLAAKLADAEKRIGQTRAAAMTNVATVAEDAAAAIAERLTGAKVAPAAAKQAVATVLAGG